MVSGRGDADIELARWPPRAQIDPSAGALGHSFIDLSDYAVSE